MLFVYFFLLQLVLSAPVKYVTRVHTAAPVTTTQTHTTGTTTIHLPPVQVLISNGQTFTSTMTESPAGVPSTTTSVVPTTEADTQGKAVDTETAQTTSEAAPETTTPATTSEAPAPETDAAPETTDAAPETEPTTTSTITSTLDTTKSTASSSSSSSSSTTTSSTSSTTTSSTTTSSTSSTIPSSVPSESGSLSPPNTIVYSPYADDGGCKSSSAVKSDLNYIKNKGISHIRTYGTDCESLKSVLSVSKDLGIGVNQGVWMSDQGPSSLKQPLEDLSDYIKQNGDDVFDFITVANEAVIMGYATVDELLDTIKSAKKQLQAAGYTGQITTAEPPVSFNQHTDLCDDDSPIDFVSINPHSYFNVDVDASQAGSFVKSEKDLVVKSCPNKKVVITETGYPSAGDTNGKNVPSLENQQIALKSLLEECGSDITILSTYNDYWKNPGPYNIEQHFGASWLFT